MSFEDEIRETMRAHDSEAPAAHGLTMPSRHSRRVRWLAPVAAAAVVIAIAGGWFAADQLTGSSKKTPVAGSAADCPATHPDDDEYWVPSKPSIAGADDRLVPDVTPESMQVCAYLHDDNELTGQQAVTGNVSEAAQTLTWLPRRVGGRACALERMITDGDNYLIRLTYPDGVVWLAAPGDHCAGASNGDFETRANLRQFAADAYQTGAWLPPGLDQPPTICGYKWAPGRLGDDTAMVPGTPDSVTICNDQREQTVVNPGALIDQLNALPTQPSTGGCHATHDPNFTMIDYHLFFNYAQGPPAVVDVLVGCAPNVDNSALQAQADQQLVELIQQMLG